MPSVRIRVSAGVGAWIVGAATATGLSLFAVSYLNGDPRNPQGATLSQAQVDQALASMTGATGSATAADTANTPAAPAASSRPGSAVAQPTPSSPAPSAPTGSAPSTSSGNAAPAPSTLSPLPAQPIERRLSVDAGTVVAQCQGTAVYLVTWSPAQGYEAQAPQRGPARLATVVFTGYGRHVEFHIGCQAGAPVPVEGDDGPNDH